MNIPLSQRCDGIIHCDNKLDEAKPTCPNRFFCANENGTKVTNVFLEFYLSALVSFYMRGLFLYLLVYQLSGIFATQI